MSSSTSSPLIDFLQRSYPSAISSAMSEIDISQSSQSIFPSTCYTDSEKVQISQWLTTSARLATSDEDEAKHAERLGSLNIHLSTRTTLLGTKPSVADVALYFRIAPAVKSWASKNRTGKHGYHNVVRFIDFVQNAPLFGLALKAEDQIKIDIDDVKYVLRPVDPKEKERRKQEKAATPGSKTEILPVGRSKEQDSKTDNRTQVQDDKSGAVVESSIPMPYSMPEKEKKNKPAKTLKPRPTEPLLSPCLIDLRVGHILRAISHPNADSLFVSTIACGDTPDTPNTSVDPSTGLIVRTVCSGLNGLIPIAELQDRHIIAVCNLKPVTMRGVKSAAMVLAASPRLAPGQEDAHKGPVELVNPPKDVVAGERVYFEGWEGEPEGVLNPKKKIWETLQPGFGTTEELQVGFDAKLVDALQKDWAGIAADGKNVARLRTKGGFCLVPSLKGAVVR